MFNLSFLFPSVLFALFALPLIWWFFKTNPPPPQTEVFPPLKLLHKLENTHTQKDNTPWWHFFLRLLLAFFLIVGLSEPVWQARQVLLGDNKPLIILLDNSWGSQASMLSLLESLQ